MKKRERRKRKSYIQDHRSRAKNVLGGEFESRFSGKKTEKSKKVKKAEKGDITSKMKEETVYIVLQTKKFAKWYSKLGKNIKNDIILSLVRIKDLGHFGDHKTIKGAKDLEELRLGSFRVYYTEKDGKIVILFIGGHKDGQKKDIKTAKKLQESLDLDDLKPFFSDNE